MKENQESRCENCIIRELNSLKVLKREELKQMSDAKESRVVKKGEHLYNEGERLKGVYCVRSGTSKVSKTANSGRDQILKLATKGAVLGQNAIITGTSSQTSVIAIEDMEVCFIPKSNIEQPLQNNLEFNRAIIKKLGADLNNSNNVLVDMSSKSVRQRLAHLLLYIEENYRTNEEGYLNLVLTRSDMAGIVGTAQELLIRTLAAFKKEGLIITHGKKIKIADPKALYSINEDL
ncbi:MAG: Crp/Fnr family transcriptional regulator [Nonlabens sp.]